MERNKVNVHTLSRTGMLNTNNNDSSICYEVSFTEIVCIHFCLYWILVDCTFLVSELRLFFITAF